ncbi:hypothetical protein C2845_PM11G28540 [Panicum miliaceum]|uniref:Secreted protein n=1 Tax=Panicum miliaceum TaxID=4540 RepID=A0A3L6RTN9_PANMI|nr:hypothetical protein C2845_PM11G28540 [Panicum miliaceum]
MKPAGRAPAALLSTFLLLCCWQIWKHRHETVFRGATPSLPRLLESCKAECLLWRCRLPAKYKDLADQWCNNFRMA